MATGELKRGVTPVEKFGTAADFAAFDEPVFDGCRYHVHDDLNTKLLTSYVRMGTFWLAFKTYDV